VREARGDGARTDNLDDFNPFVNDQASTRVCVTSCCYTFHIDICCPLGSTLNASFFLYSYSSLCLVSCCDQSKLPVSFWAYQT